jgi:30S ribosomal protein S31
MGRGDIRSRKGKISNGSYGNKRKRDSQKRAEAAKLAGTAPKKVAEAAKK